MKRLLVAGLLVLVPLAVDAALCKGKSGALAVRDRCRRKETAVDLATAGVATKGDRGATGASPTHLRAFDAAGKVIGYVNASSAVLVTSGNGTRFVAVGVEGFLQGGSLYFESINCHGQALVLSDHILVDFAPVIGTNAFFPGDPIRQSTFGSFSYPASPAACVGPGQSFDGPTRRCCSPTNSSSPAVPAVPVDLSGFTPPFRLEAAP